MLKKCVECGQLISMKAAKCPQCGALQKKQYGLKYVFFIVLSLGVFISIKETIDSANQGNIQQSKMPIRTTPKDLYNEFEDNEIAAQAKYLNTRIVITGEIFDLEIDLMGYPIIRFMPIKYKYINCQLPKQPSSEAANLRKGQQITLNCRIYKKILSMVHLEDCRMN